MRVTDKPDLILNGDMSGDVASETIDIQHLIGYAIQSVWTGSPTGNIVVQKSNDGVTWFTEDTQAAGGGAGNDLFEQADVFYKYVRVFYNSTSGTGTLNTYLFAKGV